MKRTIKLTESDLNRIVMESVRRMVNEEYPSQVSTEYIISTYYDRFEQARQLMKQVVDAYGSLYTLVNEMEEFGEGPEPTDEHELFDKGYTDDV